LQNISEINLDIEKITNPIIRRKTQLYIQKLASNMHLDEIDEQKPFKVQNESK